MHLRRKILRHHALCFLSVISACSLPSVHAADTYATHYEYDVLGRLVEVRQEKPGGKTAYEYDKAGNRTSFEQRQFTARISIDDATAVEGDTLTFTVTRSDNLGIPFSVYFSTWSRSAKYGHDYTARSGTLHFSSGQTEQSVVISTIDDTVSEPVESFSVRLSRASAGIITDSIGTGTITDNDGFILVRNADGEVQAPYTEGGLFTHLRFTYDKNGNRISTENYPYCANIYLRSYENGSSKYYKKNGGNSWLSFGYSWTGNGCELIKEKPIIADNDGFLLVRNADGKIQAPYTEKYRYGGFARSTSPRDTYDQNGNIISTNYPPFCGGSLTGGAIPGRIPWLREGYSYTGNGCELIKEQP